MKQTLCVSIMTLFLTFTSNLCNAEPLRIVTSIPPVHALVSAVTKDTVSSYTLLRNNASPHHYALSPQDATQLHNADIIFYIGPDLENFLSRPLANMPSSVKIVPLMEAPSLTLLPYEEKEVHAEEAHEEHEEHEGHEGHEGHEHHGDIDPHIWLDPNNAIVMIHHIKDVLSEADPDNAGNYTRNAANAIAAIHAADVNIAKQLAYVRQQPYITFHNGYNYFAKHYGLRPLGSITLNPELTPGAKTLKHISHLVEEQHVRCLFSETQFSQKATKTLADTLGINTANLNPLGQSGESYIDLLQTMTDSMVSCLQPTP